MVLLYLWLISLICGISAVESQIERQNNDNYDSLNRYRPTDSSSYGTSGGYYPRNTYEQLNQNNRYNVDLSGREFRPPNVFTAGLISTPTPYASPVLAQPRQYQIGGAQPLMPYPGSPLMQSSAYGGPIGSQFSGLNNPMFGYGVPSRIGIGDTAQAYGYGNFLSDPYYGMGNRQSMAISPINPYSGLYGGPQGLYSSPYLSQSPNYQSLSFANPTSGYLNRGYAAYGFGPQFGGHPYQSQAFGSGGHLGYSNGYNNYNNLNSGNYNSNSGLGSGQSSGLNDGLREEKTYASSASTQTQSEAQLGAQPSDEVPVFRSNRIIKRTDIERSAKNGPFFDHRMTE